MKLRFTHIVFEFVLLGQLFAQSPFYDFHTHEGFEHNNDKIEFSNFEFIEERKITGFCYALPVNKTKTENLYNRIESEIEQIRSIAKENQSLQILDPIGNTSQLDSNIISCSFSIEYFYGIFNNDLKIIPKFKQLGVRYITLVNNEYDKLFYNDEFTDFGLAVIKSMNDNNILIDVSHLNETQRVKVLELSSKPVIYSHTNSRDITNLDYNISLTELNLLKENGGSVFVSFNEKGLFTERSKANKGVSIFSENLLLFIEKLGVDYVGIGTDYQSSGKFIPTDLNSCSSIQKIINFMQLSGLSHTDIDKITYKNILKILSQY